MLLMIRTESKFQREQLVEFDDSMTIEACLSKLNDESDLLVNKNRQVFGLFLASHRKWLDSSKCLRYYRLNDCETVTLKRKLIPVKVRLVDDSIKTFLLDQSETVEQTIERIAHKVGIRNSETYRLQKRSEEKWLRNSAV